MPTVTCPGCQKQYKLPDSAAGQVASCKCGKRFRVGAPPVAAAAAAAPASVPKPKATASPLPKAAGAVATKQVAAKDDDFWDKALSEPVKTAPPEPTKPAPRIGAAAIAAPPDRRRRADAEVHEKKVAWGFDWGKVGGGLATFLIAGGITAALVFTTGRLFIWPTIIAVGGLLTCLAGLMGEEGIW